MLSLTRKPGSTVYVKAPNIDMIEVKILKIDLERATVRLGFKAPEEVKILREEIYKNDFED